MKNHEMIKFESDNSVVVNVFFVDISDISASLNKLRKSIEANTL